ncbi:hypothetical protein BU15DRAFT_82097 [Melanogaster broomeanus]|nr:hypothetical protein BU15DRAFT_82097 [Melanogaster broomeanus]
MKENRLVPLKDGVCSPDLEKSLLGANVNCIVDSLSFGCVLSSAPCLSFLNAHFAFQSNNAKFSRALLRRLIASFTPSNPPSIVSPRNPARYVDFCARTTSRLAALSAITALSIFAAQNHEAKQPMPETVSNASTPHLDNIPEASSAKDASPTQGPKATDALTLSLTALVLILGTIYHTHAVYAPSVEPHLAILHTLVDSGTLVGGTNADGLSPLTDTSSRTWFGPPTDDSPTHSVSLTFLLSAVAKWRGERSHSAWGAVEEIEQRTVIRTCRWLMLCNCFPVRFEAELQPKGDQRRVRHMTRKAARTQEGYASPDEATFGPLNPLTLSQLSRAGSAPQEPELATVAPTESYR